MELWLEVPAQPPYLSTFSCPPQQTQAADPWQLHIAGGCQQVVDIPQLCGCRRRPSYTAFSSALAPSAQEEAGPRCTASYAAHLYPVSGHLSKGRPEPGHPEVPQHLLHFAGDPGLKAYCPWWHEDLGVEEPQTHHCVQMCNGRRILPSACW